MNQEWKKQTRYDNARAIADSYRFRCQEILTETKRLYMCVKSQRYIYIYIFKYMCTPIEGKAQALDGRRGSAWWCRELVRLALSQYHHCLFRSTLTWRRGCRRIEISWPRRRRRRMNAHMRFRFVVSWWRRMIRMRIRRMLRMRIRTRRSIVLCFVYACQDRGRGRHPGILSIHDDRMLTRRRRRHGKGHVLAATSDTSLDKNRKKVRLVVHLDTVPPKGMNL